MSGKEKEDLKEVLRTKERELEAAIKFEKPFLVIEKLREEIKNLTKKINEAYAVVDDKVFPKLTREEIRRARAFKTYREPKSFDEDAPTEKIDESQSLTPLRGSSSAQFHIPPLGFDKDTSLITTGITTSTPAVTKPTNIRESILAVKEKQADSPKAVSSQDDEQKKEELAEINTLASASTKPPEISAQEIFESGLPEATVDQVEEIKKELLSEIDEDTFAKYLSEEDNVKDFDLTIRQGLGFREVVDKLKTKIIQYLAPKFEETRDDIPFLSAVGDDLRLHSSPVDPDNEDEHEMANRLQMKGLSLKDALDLIPRYNGENISLAQFLDGCEEAKSIVPEDFDPELAKLIRMRLYGDALNAARKEKFENMKQIAEFFEKTFGSAKTYFDLTGELAKVRQKPNEPVVVYANRLKEVENEIIKAARREGRIKDEAEFAVEFEKDCLKFFVKGLRWEIKARMAEPKSYKEAQELAIETEREYACSVTPGEQVFVKEEKKQAKEVRRVNLVNPTRSQVICSYCKKSGHGAINCFALAEAYSHSRQQQNTRGNFSRPQNSQQQRPNVSFGGWNAENRRRIDFLPESKGFNHVGGPPSKLGNPPRFDNDPRSREDYQTHRRNPSFTGGSFGNAGDNRELMCFYCRKKGHMKRDCPKFKSDSSKMNSTQGNFQTLSPAGAEKAIPANAPASSSVNQDWDKRPQTL